MKLDTRTESETVPSDGDERKEVFGELSYEAASTGLDDATNYLPTSDYAAGAIVDLGGAYAIYYPYIHPCHEPYDQWVVFYMEGAIEIIRDPGAIARLMERARPYGQLPFLTGE